MKLFLGFFEANIIAQILLIILFFWFQDAFNFFHAISVFSTGYSLFILIGLISIIAIIATLITKMFSLRGVGEKAAQAAKSRGYR
jgi:uncharacterized membrane protein